MIIFSDIDGTLINDQHQVTARTKAAIAKAVDLGHTFIPVSARMPEAIKPIIDSIGITSPIISFNGALVQDKAGHVLSSTPMDTGLALEVCDFVAETDASIALNIYSFGDWYATDRTNSWVQREESIVGLKAQEASLEQLESLVFVHKLLLMGDPEKIASLEVTLKEEYPSLSIAKSAPYFIEVMAQGIEKSKAVSFYAEQVQVPMSDTIGFGDNFNDLDMLQVVGKAYVMANGPEAVRKAIGSVTADNNSDGIAEVLERLF